MLTGKKILIGVTGSIAAYKSATLIRLLKKSGAEVQVIMTKSAEDFITALTLATLSNNKVLNNLVHEDEWVNHVMLGRWADLMLIAPASCNTLSKMANGICDNLLQAVYTSSVCPVMIAPAMDEDMWKHPSTQENILKLKGYGNSILPVETGELASGLTGDGRMTEPENIVEILISFFAGKDDLAGKKVLISAGPTYESLDPVRFIGNHSTGKMGIAIANECKSRGATVHLVLGPSVENVPQGVNITRVISAADMYEVCVQKFKTVDIGIMCAAVADYTPVTVAEEKIKKTEETFSLQLKRTPDILKKLGELKTEKQLLVGFALETENENVNALKKVTSKNADYIILNSLKDEGAGFGYGTNKITIFNKEGVVHSFEKKTKERVAADILNVILKK